MLGTGMLGDLGWRMRNGPENHTVGWGEFDVASFPHLPVKSQETGAVQVETEPAPGWPGDQAGMILEVRAGLGFV